MLLFEPVPDYHMHTPRCNHAVGSIMEYAESATLQGLPEIGVSDHSPMPDGYDEAWRMKRSQLYGYINEINDVRESLKGKLILKSGLEADYHPGTEAYVREMIDAHEWDYIIGSVHYLNDWGFDNEENLSEWSNREIENTYCDYYQLVGDSAESGLFDIIGHPDLIKKFGHRPALGSASVRQAEEQMLNRIKQADIAIEISSAGLRKPVGEVYPHARLLARAGELGIPIAFGSDAHAPGEVGFAMQTCLGILHACGIREVASFSQRRRKMLPIIPA